MAKYLIASAMSWLIDFVIDGFGQSLGVIDGFGFDEFDTQCWISVTESRIFVNKYCFVFILLDQNNFETIRDILDVIIESHSSCFVSRITNEDGLQNVHSKNQILAPFLSLILFYMLLISYNCYLRLIVACVTKSINV